MEEKKVVRIEKRFNVWWYIAALYVSFFVGNYFNNEVTLYTFVGQLNMLLGTVNSFTPYGLGVAVRFIIPLISVGVFELFSRVFYGVSNALSLGSLNLKSSDFVSVVRIFVIGANLVLGVLNVMYYCFNFLIPIGQTIVTFIIITVAYIMFFNYLNKYYLDKKMAHRAFRTMAIIYLAVTFFGFMGGLI